MRCWGKGLGLAGLIGLTAAFGGGEAGAVAPVRKAAPVALPVSTGAATTPDHIQLQRMRPDPSPATEEPTARREGSNPAAAKPPRGTKPSVAGGSKPAPPPRTTELAALPPAKAAPPPRPRIAPGALTDRPKARPSVPAASQAEPGAEARTQTPAPTKAEIVFEADPQVPLSSVAVATAKQHGVDPILVNAVILAESHYDPKALSHKGAMGLMQLIPQTAARYGVKDAWNPKQNIDGGVRYLRDLVKQFGDIELVLAAYNAGEEAVERYGRNIPPYAETETYVARATAYMARLQDGAKISRLRKTGSGVGGRLSGWGIIFGSFPDSGEANRVARDHGKLLVGVIAGGRAAVVSRKHESLRPYAALIVGLNQDNAVKACRHVSGGGGYCLPIAPEQLRDPKALWR